MFMVLGFRVWGLELEFIVVGECLGLRVSI